MTLPQITDFHDSSPCSCATCQGYCSRPCWTTPEDAERLLDAGEAPRLMLDAWLESKELPTTYLVCPANPGHEGAMAPGLEDDSPFGSLFFSIGLLTGDNPMLSGCVMHRGDGGCDLHARGLKPSEGRIAHHANGRANDNLHLACAVAWNSPDGRRIVARFCDLVNLENPYLREDS